MRTICRVRVRVHVLRLLVHVQQMRPVWMERRSAVERRGNAPTGRRSWRRPALCALSIPAICISEITEMDLGKCCTMLHVRGHAHIGCRSMAATVEATTHMDGDPPITDAIVVCCARACACLGRGLGGVG